MKNLLFFTLLLFALHTSAQEAYNKGNVFIDVCTSIGNAGVGYGGEIHYAFAPLFSVGAQFNSQSFNSTISTITSFLPKTLCRLSLWQSHYYRLVCRTFRRIILSGRAMTLMKMLAILVV